MPGPEEWSGNYSLTFYFKMISLYHVESVLICYRFTVGTCLLVYCRLVHRDSISSASGLRNRASHLKMYFFMEDHFLLIGKNVKT